MCNSRSGSPPGGSHSAEASHVALLPPLSVPNPGLLRWHGQSEGQATFQKDPSLLIWSKKPDLACCSHAHALLPVCSPWRWVGPGPQHHVLQLESDLRGDPTDLRATLRPFWGLATPTLSQAAPEAETDTEPVGAETAGAVAGTCMGREHT